MTTDDQGGGTTPRRAELDRETRETRVHVRLALDGTGQVEVATGIGMFDHLITSMAYHGGLDLELQASGDLDVDEHHTVEDVALSLGQALSAALGDRVGIERFGEASVPMDEALARAALDLSGRPYAILRLPFVGERIGGLPTQLIPHALESFARTSGSTLHLRASGRNDHHIAEAAFKAVGRALRQAVALDPRRSGVPSIKGTMERPA